VKPDPARAEAVTREAATLLRTAPAVTKRELRRPATSAAERAAIEASLRDHYACRQGGSAQP
jgi:hypothetical protein